MTGNAYRIGIDFGYGFTGLALLSAGNEVIDFAVIEHRQLTKDLENRRANRSLKRSKKSKRKRLRDFKAFLKGIGIAPDETLTKTHNNKNLPIGNRLYALAHLRGWDYADLDTLLVDNLDNDKEPKPSATSRAVDRILIQEFGAPIKTGKPPAKPKKSAPAEKKNNFEENKKNFAAAQELVAQGRTGKGQENSIVHWLEPQTSCLGVYADMLALLEKEADEEKAAALCAHTYKLVDETGKADSDRTDNKDAIDTWLNERVTSCLGQSDDSAVKRVRVMLGLEDNRDLFEKGRVYAPIRNRHRSVMKDELGQLMDEALASPV